MKVSCNRHIDYQTWCPSCRAANLQAWRQAALNETRWFKQDETSAQLAARIETHRSRIATERNTERGR